MNIFISTLLRHVYTSVLHTPALQNIFSVAYFTENNFQRVVARDCCSAQGGLNLAFLPPLDDVGRIRDGRRHFHCHDNDFNEPHKPFVVPSIYILQYNYITGGF